MQWLSIIVLGLVVLAGLALLLGMAMDIQGGSEPRRKDGVLVAFAMLLVFLIAMICFPALFTVLE